MEFELAEHDVDAYLKELKEERSADGEAGFQMMLTPDEIEEMKIVTLPGLRDFARGHHLIDRLRHPDFFRNVFVFTKASAVKYVLEEIEDLAPNRAGSTSMEQIYRKVARRVCSKLCFSGPITKTCSNITLFVLSSFAKAQNPAGRQSGDVCTSSCRWA